MLFGWPTLGGLQLYWDVEVGDGWRVQENSLTRSSKRFRLINRFGLRLAGGDLQHCREVRKTKFPSDKPLEQKSTVILLHGLGRTRHCFRAMAKALQLAGYATLSVSYASTRGSTEDHADRLISVLTELPEDNDLLFVSHSFGGLVLRQTLADPRLSNLQHRFRAAVLLGPPNRGAHLAYVLGKQIWFRALLGKGGQSVTPDAVRSLPGLAIPYLIVAGVRDRAQGYNPMLSGDDDGIVALSEVELAGAQQIIQVPVAHSFLMSNSRSIENTKEFLLVSAPPQSLRAKNIK